MAPPIVVYEVLNWSKYLRPLTWLIKMSDIANLL